ncbi:MAG: NADH-quinone oxidoreductase subunit N [Acidimicrobiales bacterium]|nr:NADH-quinone oxidoreductase subunit N [Acidimicrobiales bacterium]
MFSLAIAPNFASTIVTPDIAWVALLPLLILSGAAILLLTIASIAPKDLSSSAFALFTGISALASAISAIPLWTRVQDAERGPFNTIAGGFSVDGFSLLITFLILISVILVTCLASAYLSDEGVAGPEPYALILLSATGGIIIAGASDLIVLFLGIEVLSIAAYVLAALDMRRVQSQEAGMKYFVLGAFASGFLLYGIALIYGATGSTSLSAIREFLDSAELTNDALLLTGIAMVLIGLGFKVATVPFHFWTPDVYQGSPTPFVAYMASAVKAAGFAALIRVFYGALLSYQTDWKPIIYGLAIATLVVGSLMAIVQTDVKRLLAYSSISHAGYILVGFQSGSNDGVTSVSFYLITYAFMVLGSFTIVSIVGRLSGGKTNLQDFEGLASRRPILAAVFTVFLLGQAGIPLTTGFFAKFYVIEAAIEARSFGLAVTAMVTAVIAAFLYLKILVRMWLDDNDESDRMSMRQARANIPIPFQVGFVLLISGGFTLFFGIWPEPIVELVREALPIL